VTLFTPQRLITTTDGHRRYRPERRPGSSDDFLGRNRRLLAAAVIVATSVTFSIPVIRTDIRLAGETRWSPLSVMQGAYAGTLPAPIWCETCGEPTIRTLLALPIEVSLSYAALVLALLTLLFPERPGLLGGIAFMAGADVLVAEGKFRQISDGFAESFGLHRGQVHCGTLTFVLLGSMVALFYISITPSLDRPKCPGDEKK
jgi:hypothetical protein